MGRRRHTERNELRHRDGERKRDIERRQKGGGEGHLDTERCRWNEREMQKQKEREIIFKEKEKKGR